MAKKIIHFIGFVANADKSVSKIQLKHGFTFQVLSWDEASQLLSKLETSLWDAIRRLCMDLPCCSLDGKYFVCIVNTFEDDVEFTDKGGLAKLPGELCKFQKELVTNYLTKTWRALRLFKEGNVGLPVSYYYIADGMNKVLMGNLNSRFYRSRSAYTLDDAELLSLMRFLNEVEIPFQSDFLELGLENYELSHDTDRPTLEFLSLMISLETLLNPGGGELIYRISRNAAVLLGKNENESKLIFDDIKLLYHKRSQIVHTGSIKVIDIEDVLRLREYVRRCIKRIHKLNLNKPELLDILNSSGFGCFCSDK